MGRIEAKVAVAGVSFGSKMSGKVEVPVHGFGMELPLLPPDEPLPPVDEVLNDHISRPYEPYPSYRTIRM